MKTSISFLKSNLSRRETINELEKTDTDYIHVDIMDGRFVDREVLSIDETIELFKETTKPLDIHLMVDYPFDYIERLSVLKPKYITIHAELNVDPAEYLNIIKTNGIKCGIAINPETSVIAIQKYLTKVDYVLIMGVTPGAGGQKLIPETVNKINELRVLREYNNYSYSISLDGGVNEETIKYLSGLDIVVSGSYVCMSDNYQEKIDTLRHV